MSLRTYYKDKKVFVTGITGFKGAWLAYLLNKLGAKVSGLGLENPNKNTAFFDLKISEISNVFYEDIRKELSEEISNELKESDYIFHLAAQPIVSVGYKDPIGTFNANLMGTVRILDAVKLTEKPITVLSVASDRVYDPSHKNHSEESSLAGFEPYSLSKVFSNQVVDMYRQMDGVSNKLKLINARASNVIGGGDKGESRIITSIYEAIEGNKPIELRNPTFIRPYVYVLDCLGMYLQIAAKGKFDTYNVGVKNTTVSVQELVDSFIDWYPHLTSVNTGVKFGFEGNELSINTDRVEKEFGDLRITNNISDVVERITKFNDADSNNKLLIAEQLISEVVDIYK